MSTLTELADGVWEVTTFLKLPGGVAMPARTSVLRDGDGGLVLYSPLDFDDRTADAIEALGEVRTIIGPSLFHHLYLRHAKERWPGARLLGAPGLDVKRKNLAFDGTLQDGAVSPGVEAVLIGGMPKLNEAVLVHTPSRTLVCSDLTFRIRQASGISKLAFKMMGDWGETLKTSRLWKLGIKDRQAYTASMDALLSKDFDGVVMAHGDPVLEGGKAQLEALTR